jgi:hypothetical protein
MSEIIEMEWQGSAPTQGNWTDTPGSFSDERRQQTEVTAIHIKMQHTQVTEMRIKLTVKRNSVENIQLLYQMRHIQ